VERWAQAVSEDNRLLGEQMVSMTKLAAAGGADCRS
jgi:hypothetical protein